MQICLLEGCDNPRMESVQKDGRRYLLKGCSHEHSKKINAIQSGVSNKGKKRAKPFPQEKKALLEEKGYHIISLPERGVTEKITFQCQECGTAFKRAFHNAVKETAKVVCPDCSKKTFNQHLKKTFQNSKDFLETEGVIILSESPSAVSIVDAICQCGEKFQRRFGDIVHLGQTKCIKCSLHSGRSKQEKDFFDWAQETLNRKLISSYTGWSDDSPRLEIDVFDPSTNIGIEFCGEFAHSTLRQKGNQSHFHKFCKAEKAGIKLLTLFSHEVDLDSETFRKWFLSFFGIFDRTFHARKLKVIDDVPSSFHQENHFQGRPHHSLLDIGLIDPSTNELIMAICLSRHPRKSDQMVLSRMTAKFGCRIIGGASRLISKIDVPILTWSDNRWSNGNVYRAIGFELLEVQKADYFYWSRKTGKVSKQSMKGKNERERAEEMGLLKIYDCGKKLWRKS